MSSRPESLVRMRRSLAATDPICLMREERKNPPLCSMRGRSTPWARARRRRQRPEPVSGAGTGTGGGGGFGGGGSSTTVPGAPVNLTAVGGDGEVVLSWVVPENDGGSEITDYQYRIDGGIPGLPSAPPTPPIRSPVSSTARSTSSRCGRVNRIGRGRASNRAEAVRHWRQALRRRSQRSCRRWKDFLPIVAAVRALAQCAPSVSYGAICGHLSEIGAVCGKAARTDLRGGRRATAVPTATPRTDSSVLRSAVNGGRSPACRPESRRIETRQGWSLTPHPARTLLIWERRHLANRTKVWHLHPFAVLHGRLLPDEPRRRVRDRLIDVHSGCRSSRQDDTNS